jgi:ABC-type bacteriocin/lantibiotic exporter with double-glycine peptidase domain
MFFLLSAKDKRSALILLFMLLGGMLLEMLSLGLVIPMIVAITKIEVLTSNPIVSKVLVFLGRPSQTQIILFILIGLVVVYILKTCYLLFLIWRQSLFSQKISMNLSRQLFDGYLKQSYSFHLQRNSAQLYRNVLGEVDIFTSVTQSILLLQTNISIFLAVLVSLFLIEPVGAFFVFLIIILFSLIYFRIIRKTIIRWGIKRQYHDILRSKHLMQGLGGVKDIKILGREKYFLSQFEQHNKGSFDIGVKVNVFQQAPRLLLELLAIIALSIFLITTISQGKPLYFIIPIIGVFVAAAFRLIPALSSVMSAVQTLRYATPVMDLMYEEVQSFKEKSFVEKKSNFVFESHISLEAISFKYDGSEATILDNINLVVEKNKMIGFVGESGAGKSTLVDIILGLLKVNKGQIKVDGRIDIYSNLRGWQDQIGYVPQTIYLTDDTIAKNIAFGLDEKNIDHNALNNTIKVAQLDQFIKDLPEGVETIVGERGVRISGGQRQRIGIARALYHNPSILVLDEATSSLDVDTEKWVMEAINELQYNKTIIIITHRLSTVDHCDQIYKIEKGRLSEYFKMNSSNISNK